MLASGISTVAFAVPDPTGDWIVRVNRDYPQPWQWRGGRGFEVPLLRSLADRGLGVVTEPTAIADEANSGVVAIIGRRVGGVPVSSFADPPASLVPQLTAFLRALHQVPIESAAELGVPVHDHVGAIRTALREGERLLDPVTLAWALAAVDEIASDPIQPALVHGDFRADHWFTDAGGALTAVIDFGDSHIGDKAFDFARFPDEFDGGLMAPVAAAYPDPDGRLVRRGRLYQLLEPVFRLGVEGDGSRRAVTELSTRARMSG